MSTATTAIEEVAGNEDLLQQILLRLPAISLIRFKLVSKRWYSLISDPQFIKTHSRQEPNNLPTGILYSDLIKRSNNIHFVSFNGEHPLQTIPPLAFLSDVADFPEYEIEILHSCNGLLLCLVSTPLKSYNYVVCNPTTKKYRVIRSVYGPISGRFTFTLAFDPSISLDYEVLMTRASCSSRIGSGGTCEICLYSSHDNCWRDCDSSPFEPPEAGLFLIGVIYWIEFHKEYSLRFDVGLRKMVEIAVPPPKALAYYFKRLSVSGNSLKCIGQSDDDATSFCVLEMASDFSEWITKYRFSGCPIVDAFPEVHFVLPEYGNVGHRMSVLCLVEGVKEEYSELVFAIPGKVISYDLMKGAVKEIARLDGELAAPSEYSNVRAFEFVESLVLV